MGVHGTEPNSSLGVIGANGFGTAHCGRAAHRCVYVGQQLGSAGVDGVDGSAALAHTIGLKP